MLNFMFMLLWPSKRGGFGEFGILEREEAFPFFSFFLGKYNDNANVFRIA